MEDKAFGDMISEEETYREKNEAKGAESWTPAPRVLWVGTHRAAILERTPSYSLKTVSTKFNFFQFQ